MFLRWSSLHNTNAKGTNTFDSSLSLELDVDVSSWLKLKARHWWSLQVAPPYTMWEALLCIHLHLSIMWSSTSFKHVILRDGYLELALVNHDHQHLMSSSHRHLKSLSRCEPMRITFIFTPRLILMSWRPYWILHYASFLQDMITNISIIIWPYRVYPWIPYWSSFVLLHAPSQSLERQNEFFTWITCFKTWWAHHYLIFKPYLEFFSLIILLRSWSHLVHIWFNHWTQAWCISICWWHTFQIHPISLMHHSWNKPSYITWCHCFFIGIVIHYQVSTHIFMLMDFIHQFIQYSSCIANGTFLQMYISMQTLVH
jgi:hypothetical protein